MLPRARAPRRDAIRLRNLIRQRLSEGFSVEAVAAALGVHRSTVFRARASWMNANRGAP